jgi:hypothetical protein
MTLYDSVIFWGLGSNQSEQLVILSTNKVWVICRQSDPAIEIQRTFRVGSHQDLTTMLDHSFRLNQPKSAGSCYFLSRERFSRCRAARLAGGNIDVSTHWAKIRKASFQGIIWCLLHISLTFLKMFRSMHEIPGTLQPDFQGVCSLPQTSKDVYFFVFKHGLLETRQFSPSTFPFKCPFSSVNSQLVMFDDARG